MYQRQRNGDQINYEIFKINHLDFLRCVLDTGLVLRTFGLNTGITYTLICCR